MTDSADCWSYAHYVARPVRQLPRELTTLWPSVPSADPRGEVARLFAASLRVALDGLTVRAAAELTGVNRSSVAAILAGTTWPDMATIARLEDGLKRPLWPRIGPDGVYQLAPNVPRPSGRAG